MQNRQYYLHPYQTEYSTEVITSNGVEGQYHVVLANTVFYPEGGGQPADRGLINDIPVLHVYETADQQIVHILPQDPGQGEVLCRLDWQRRFYHMQHHTGQHLLSAVFYRKYNVQTMGFHLSEQYATLDLDIAVLTPELLTAAEQEVNRLVQQNLPVKIYFISAAECQQHALLRKQPQVDSDIRIVEIDNYDAVPCCGTHVANTGEIGLIKVIKTEKVRGMTRLYYRCGQEAYRDYQFKHDLVTNLANIFSSSDQDVLDRVMAELERKSELERELKNVKQQLFRYEANGLVAQAKGRVIIHYLDADADIDSAQILIKEILALGHFLVLVSVGNRVFLSHNLEDDLDCGALVKTHASEYGGRGGGKKDFAQVFFPSHDLLQQFVSSVETGVEK